MAGGVMSCGGKEDVISSSSSKREKEKEKTRLRERKRRSITTKILDGLRKHGGYRLPHRADINDVLRALAREAGWTVLPDGTTYRTAAGPILPPPPPPPPPPQETRHVSYSPSSAAVPDGGGGNGNGSSTLLLPLLAGPIAEFASYMATGGAHFAASGPTLYAVEPGQYQEQLGVIDFM